MSHAQRHLPGLTLRSLLASLFAIAAMALITLFFEAIEGRNTYCGLLVLPLGVMFVFIPLALAGGAWRALTGRSLLTRAELLTCLLAMLMAAPLTAGGFWGMMIGAIGTIPKTADFETYDAWPSKLWPHGPNLTKNALDPSRQDRLLTTGDVRWEELEYEKGRRAQLPVLRNEKSSQVSWVRVRVPIYKDDAAGGAPVFNLLYEEPYLLSVLMRPRQMGAEAYYYTRVFYDDQPHFATEAFSLRAAGSVNYLHQTGFLRKGMYDLTIARSATRSIDIEIGLVGHGTLELAQVELMNVGTLNAIYHGRRVMTQSQFEQAGETPRTELLVRPDNLWSPAGLRFLLTGYVPWRQWLTPMTAWAGFAALILMATFAMGTIMRRQWIDRERYGLPMTRIPVALLGESDGDHGALPPIWRNQMMWLGFALSLAWCLMKGWHAYNLNVPNMNIEVQLTPYFTDPMWGKMWRGEEMRNVTFLVTAIFVSIAIFMELNVLMSLVLGFFLFRSQYWLGEVTGLALKKDYPFPQHQQVGAYLVYALLILFFARKYLWRVLKSVFARAQEGQESYRWPLAVLALCLAGAAGWAHWMGMPIAGILIFFVFLLLVGLVAAKVRAECGTPLAMFTPVNVFQLLPLAGGMVLLGPAGVLFVIFSNWIMFKGTFFLMPGAQMEWIELGRRYRISGRQVWLTGLLGIAGGLLIGGWVFLSLGYSQGGDNFTERWAYMDKAFLVNDYHTLMAKANTTLSEGAAQADAPQAGLKIDPPMFGYMFAGAVTLLLTVLRQVFSGFWFHPMGFIVSSTPMMEYAWGSILVAWLIRWGTLKLGGAVTVRNKLLPFFVGVFLASVTAYLIFSLINGYLYFMQPGVVRQSTFYWF